METVVCACCEASRVTFRNIGTFKVCESCFKKLKRNEFVPELSGTVDMYGYRIKPPKPTGRHIYIKDGDLVAGYIKKEGVQNESF
jgi:hypothetical protein